jgi:hypothetical protein
MASAFQEIDKLPGCVDIRDRYYLVLQYHQKVNTSLKNEMSIRLSGLSKK